MNIKKQIYINYLFPGVMCPEISIHPVIDTSLPTVIPSDCYGFYFTETNCIIHDYKQFKGETNKIGKTFIVGKSYHIDKISNQDECGRSNDILKENIKYGSPFKMGIKTHLGNWVIKDENTEEISPYLVKFGKPQFYKKFEKNEY